eukprot:366349-Chlamydomonas_euryale.AAC.3
MGATNATAVSAAQPGGNCRGRDAGGFVGFIRPRRAGFAATEATAALAAPPGLAALRAVRASPADA